MMILGSLSIESGRRLPIGGVALAAKGKIMTALIERNVGGRNCFVYEVAIEYSLTRAVGNPTPQEVFHGAYIRLFDCPDVPTACNKASEKFDGFVQSQGAQIVEAVVRRCDLKFQGHTF